MPQLHFKAYIHANMLLRLSLQGIEIETCDVYLCENLVDRFELPRIHHLPAKIWRTLELMAYQSIVGANKIEAAQSLDLFFAKMLKGELPRLPY